MATISSQCYISIPPENRKPQSFIIFSGGIEVWYWEEMVWSWDIKIKLLGWQYYFREDHLHSSFELFCNPFPSINFAPVAFDDIDLTLNIWKLYWNKN